MSFPINAEMQNKPIHQMQKAGAFIHGCGLKMFFLFFQIFWKPFALVIGNVLRHVFVAWETVLLDELEEVGCCFI